jgi:phosphatidylethanolamine/phosphatidyl-N-methylethanolamine N-methyltransferase
MSIFMPGKTSMPNPLTDHIKRTFSHEIDFLKAMRSQPGTIGAIWPTGPALAQKMASVIDVHSSLPVLELGPGTGPITSAILNRGVLPQNLHTVEFNKDFADMLKSKYPDVNVIQGDAFDLDTALGKHRDTVYDCAISALPLLNFPRAMRAPYIEQILKRLPAGRPLVQFSYGLRAPVQAKAGSFSTEHYGMTLVNMPPAQLWVYKQL